MKRLPSLLFTCAFVCVTSIKADPSLEAPPLNIRLELQVVAVPEKVGIPLAMDMKKKDKIEVANTKIQELLANGTAKLVGWPIIITHSGQRAVCEAIKEIRYATEYGPPTVSVSPDLPTDTTVKVAPTVDVTTFDGVPAAFETRNCGVTFEVEPVLSADGKTIDLNMVPQTVRLKGYHKVTIEGAARKGKVIVEQPQFDTNKITTSLTMRSGERILLGVYPIDDPPKHLEFFILKAEAIPVE
jgi:Flp pilus assembly secretin CpaC